VLEYRTVARSASRTSTSCRGRSDRGTAGSTRRSPRRRRPPGGSPPPTRNLQTSRSAPNSAAGSGRFVAEKGTCSSGRTTPQVEVAFSRAPLRGRGADPAGSAVGTTSIRRRRPPSSASTCPDVTPGACRRRAKVINFGILYGNEPFGPLARAGIGGKEAKTYIDHYFDRYPA